MHAGYTINQYKIIDRIGEGGMGVVYLAEDTRLYRKVALKFVSNSSLDSTEEIARFQREARAAARLNHPNICTVHELGETEDKTYIAMEYVEGVTLKERIGQGNITEEDIRKWLLQIAEGLHVAHEAGVIHRDIKPANIMMTDAGLIKIMDFGIAKLMESDTELTRANSTIGTIAYMSPEQARGETINRQTDIWSVGVILYELATGKRPFEGAFREAVMYAMMHDDPKPPSSINPDVAPELEEVIKRCLQKDRAERYASLEVLLNDLTGSGQTSAHTVQNAIQEGKSEKGVITSISAHAGSRKSLKIQQSKRLVYALAGLIILIAIGLSATWIVDRQAKVIWAQEDLLPQIERLAQDISWSGEGTFGSDAYRLVQEAERHIPDDLLLVRLTEIVSRQRDVLTWPEGADVYVKPYTQVDSVWTHLGVTPIYDARLPVGFSRLKVEKAGYERLDDIVWVTDYNKDAEEAPPRPIQYWLTEQGALPEGMVMLRDSSDWYDLYPAPAGLQLPGLEKMEKEQVGDFLMDRYEVSNQAYKRFVESGGYENPVYWQYPFIKDGVEILFEEAISFFKDKTGRTGPATWQVGDYPDGEGSYPVGGVSWYEASAYCEYVGKSLPTIYHWDRAALAYGTSDITEYSNLSNSNGTLPVGQSNSLHRYGIHDLAGNVREWVVNESDRGGTYVMGGGWNDQKFAFGEATTVLPTFNRSESTGFRCIMYVDDGLDKSRLAKVIPSPFRDFSKEDPVSDETFSLYRNQFIYDSTPLEVQVESSEEQEDWILEQISFKTAYGDERMNAFLFLPKEGIPPYQTVIYFPGSDAAYSRTTARLSKDMSIAKNEMFPKSGRALLWPIYNGTYDRHVKEDNLLTNLTWPNPSAFFRDYTIMQVKDIMRSIDYLETRDDIDADRLAFYGNSLGTFHGSLAMAVDPRIKTGVMYVAGLMFDKALPEIEPFNYLPRVTQPVLMVNGELDFFVPYESSQRPFYELLGTPEEDKEMLIVHGGHSVPATVLMESTLSWLDKYLGPIN